MNNENYAVYNNQLDSIKMIVFDLDDTLVECGKYYWSARDRFVRKASKKHGLTYEFVADLFSTIDGEMLKLPGAFKRDRFPRAFRTTALALDGMMGNNYLDEEFAEEAYRIGESVFQAAYPTFPGVKTVLSDLKKEGYPMVINTKGAQDVQKRKIQKNDLEKYMDRVYISLKKDKRRLKGIINDFGFEPEEILCVGDSMRDDVVTPTDTGCQTMFIGPVPPLEWKPKWEYEAQGRGLVLPNYWATSVAYVPEIFNNGVETDLD